MEMKAEMDIMETMAVKQVELLAQMYSKAVDDICLYQKTNKFDADYVRLNERIRCIREIQYRFLDLTKSEIVKIWTS